MAITIKDIARNCGVGIATVSRAINNSGSVKKDVKEAILQYAESIGWQASNAATALKTGKTKTVAFLVNTLLHSYNANILEEAVHMLRDKGFCSFIHIGRNLEYRKKEIESIIHRNVDAVIVFGEHKLLNDDLPKLEKEGIKTVILGKTTLDSCSSICQDDELCGYDAMKLLIENGHRDIAFVDGFGKKEYISSIEETTIEGARLTLTGIMEAAKEMNVDFNLKRDTIGDCFRDFGYMKKKILERKHTAYICDGTEILTKFYEICSKNKINIPEKTSVIGISGLESFRAYSPAPFYYQHDFKEISRQSVEFIASGKKKANIKIPLKLMPGKSIKKIK